ncbi:MAG: TPM domain-containing protein [Dysgonamonadaceae bacterium]|jgi:uncharacterized protein|nr:TPM domain-containing protein [Dysgonamonadaceae bacterium]
MKQKMLLLSFLLFGFSLKSQTYTVHSVPYDNLKDKYDFVSNPDRIISPAAEEQINRIITLTEDSASAEIAVVLLKSIGDAGIDDFGTALFTHWGIGKKQKDNGLLFLLVEDQRQMIFRTGYGLEGALPDVVLSRIIRNDIAPLMAEGNPDRALISGISRVCQCLLNPEVVREILAEQKHAGGNDEKAVFPKLLKVYTVISLLVFLYFALTFSLKLKMGKTRPEKYNRLNAARSSVIACTVLFPLLMVFFIPVYFFKLRNLRNRPVNCRGCNRPMIKQTESSRDAYLTAQQVEEEKLHSVDYDVWRCTACNRNEIYGYDRPHTRYTTCPYCRARTYLLESDRIVKHATSYSKGRGEKVYRCLYCQKRNIVPYLIPMIIASPGTGGRRSGGFGGGSFGGGFGGGRTGGGGARGGW